MFLVAFSYLYNLCFFLPLKSLVWCLQISPVQTSMWPYFIIPFKKFFFVNECVSMPFISVKPFFHFAIALRVFDSAEYWFDFLFCKKCLKQGISANIAYKLASMVHYAL